MLRKPWPIVFIALLFYLIPFVNLFVTYYPLRLEITPQEYLLGLLSHSDNYFNLFTMVAPSLIAGYAIISIRKWSYTVFLVCLMWITVQVIRDFSPTMDKTQFLLLVLMPIIVNFLCVSYFLLPEVRATYFDKRLRWWETKPRYLFTTDVAIVLDSKTFVGEITNISVGGIFIKLSESFDTNLPFSVKFVIENKTFLLNAKVAYSSPDGISHGIQFLNVRKSDHRELNKTINYLKRSNYKELRPEKIWIEDLVNWFKVLILTGKGLIPDISQKNK